jgi:hypothetical protein
MDTLTNKLFAVVLGMTIFFGCEYSLAQFIDYRVEKNLQQMMMYGVQV